MNKELKNEIIKKMIIYFGYNNNHINHTYRVLDYTEEISDIEKGDPDIVIYSAILHDVGIPVCEIVGCYHLLLQIAHILSQLIEKGSLLKDKIEKVLAALPMFFTCF